MASRPSPATSTPTSPETCLHYIGGIIKHAKAINAFTNPSTNSYKRLVPGYEAPVLLAYPRVTARRRAASRTPQTRRPSASRFASSIRWPIRTWAFAAMLMAGLDGIKNKIDPGPAMDKDLYDLPKEELKTIPTVCGSLREALENLDKDRAFLKGWRRVRRRLHRQLHRTEDDGSRAVRNDPASDRVRDVLTRNDVPRLTARCIGDIKGVPHGTPFLLTHVQPSLFVQQNSALKGGGAKPPCGVIP